VAVTGISAKEGSRFYVAVIAAKSIHGHIHYTVPKRLSLSDTKKTCMMPEHMTTPQLVV